MKALPLTVFVAALSLALGVSAFTVANARTIHVDFAVAQFVAPPARNGDAATPFLGIGEALRVAVAGDVVVVHPESYRVNLDLPAGVELRAAFPAYGADTPLEDITQLVVADKTRPGITVAGDDARTAVIGFQITDGGAERGAGIFVVEGRARIEDNFFFLNGAGGAAPLGGAIAVFDAPDGALPQGEFHVSIRHNGFVANTALTADGKGRGGGVACRANRNQPRILIDENEFRAPIPGFENNADYGGGVYIEQCDSVVRANLFEQNMARFHGAGLYCTGEGSNAPALLLLEENLFRQNHAVTGAGGGAFMSRCSSQIDHNTVVLNVAATDGGGITCVGVCNFTARAGRNHIEDNLAGRNGGGLALIDPHDGSGIDRVLLRANSADSDEDGSGDGGGLYVAADTTNARELVVVGRLDEDSIIDENSAVRGGGVAIVGRITNGEVVANQHVRMRGYRVSDNKATFGGGIYIGGAGQMTLGEFIAVLGLFGPIPLGNLLQDNLALANGGALYVDDRAKLVAFSNRIGEPGGNGNLAEDGDGGGLWSHAGSDVTAWFNCIAGNTAHRGGGAFTSGKEQRMRANSFYQNSAATGGGGFALGASQWSLNAVHASTGGGLACGAGGGDLRMNRVQANAPYDIDSASCGDGVDNKTGALTRVRGIYGARHLFPACGPAEPDEEADAPQGDFGDAPDDSHGDFLAGYHGAYAEVAGKFPTYRDTRNASDGGHGPSHGFLSMYWLGGVDGDGLPAVSNDRGVESAFDDDLVPNLDRDDLSADQDGLDDGWAPLLLAPCESQEIAITISAAAALADLPVAPAYLNVLADWNHDGRWGGPGGSGSACGAARSEWIVRDQVVQPEAGGTITVSQTIASGDAGDVWIRVMLAESPLGALDDWDGAVVASFALGETEDHRVCVGASAAACEDGGAADDGPVEAGPDGASEAEEIGVEVAEVESGPDGAEAVEEGDAAGPDAGDTGSGEDATVGAEPTSDTTTGDDASNAEDTASEAPKGKDGCATGATDLGLLLALYSSLALLVCVRRVRGRPAAR